MTDGRVQKVLSKYRPLRKGNGNYPYFTPRIFLALQQDVIKGINQELDSTIKNHGGINSGCCVEDSNLKERLIGDVK